MPVTAKFNIASYFVDRHVIEGTGERPALIHDDTTTSYAKLAGLVNRAGNVLLDLGVARGDRVLLILSDSVEFVACWYAAQKIGAITAEAYTFLPAKDYAHFLSYTEADVVIVDTVALDAVREACALGRTPKHLLVFGADDAELRAGDGAHGLPLSTALAQASDQLDPAPTTVDDVAIWKFTTGSTGTPKACVHTVGAPLASYETYAQSVLGIRDADRVIAVPKLFFGYARDLVALYPFAVGAAGVIFGERSTPELLFELTRRHRATILVNVPTMMSAMLASPALVDADLSSLRLCTSAGEALPADLLRAWQERIGVDVIDGVGSSEAYHIYLSQRPGEATPGDVGTPVPGYRARVVDDDGNEVPTGNVGVLEVSGPTIAREYYRDPVKSAHTFRGDTVHTGDLFSVDERGHYHHHGRADDLLKVGGIWVAPSEIEHCLIGHPDVVECGVIGHTEAGLVRPRAYVVLREGAATTEDELISYAQERLAGHKRPRDVRFVAELPRTSNGKLDRRALRAREETS
ncbi:MAG: benzoate-CoA ligase family protein [Actinophytocola sp.]|nr:benzoate-CoA ligase family protein [Actinophytocola sp.]